MNPNPVHKKPATIKLANTSMQLSPKGLSFIQDHEGFGKLVKDGFGKWHHVNPYNDSKGYATTGYGHLLHQSPVNATDVAKYKNMTKVEALILLKQDLQNMVPEINELIEVPLTQYQFDAIVSFSFNVGVGSRVKGSGLAGSKFLEELNKGNYYGMLMMHFHRPPEIIGRRMDEVNLFTFGCYTYRNNGKKPIQVDSVPNLSNLT